MRPEFDTISRNFTHVVHLFSIVIVKLFNTGMAEATNQLKSMEIVVLCVEFEATNTLKSFLENFITDFFVGG